LSEDARDPGDWVPETPEIAELLEVAEREGMARRETHEAVYDRPLEDRVAAGLAVDGLRYEGESRERGEPMRVFSAPSNESRFRPGARLRLSHGDPRRPVARFELVHDRRDASGYRFVLSGSVEDPAVLESSEPWVLDEDVFDLLDLQREILRCAERVGLDAWLSGGESEEEPPAGGPSSPYAEGLEESARAAFSCALGCRAWAAVQGPPGTGKTHLLARLALHLAREEGARVLVTAVSHQAIHNALGEVFWTARRLRAEHPGLEEFIGESLFKLGASRGHNEGLPEGVRPALRLPKRPGGLIAGATVYAAAQQASDLSAGRPPYDVVLFDEAGQAPLGLALGARLLGRRTVFIGDDAQLPPVVESSSYDGDEPPPRVSVMSHLRRRYGDPPMLARTRRLNRELCSVVSDLFYGGRLEPTAEAAPRVLTLGRRPAPGFDEVLRPENALVFVDVPHEECRSVSEKEALWAAALAREAARCGLPPEGIGIIAPYRAQCNRVRFLLEGTRTLCATVERFQGQEREMVVLSLTSSKPAYLARLAGFLFDPNRLNVALSRARTKVVVLGARKALSLAVEGAEADAPYAAGLRVFQRLLERAKAVDGSRLPAAPKEAPAPEAAPPAGSPAAFEPGEGVEHGRHGRGIVLRRSLQLVDGEEEWVLEVRFGDGGTRSILPRLCDPPLRKTT
jgi:DNA replication ATP-dependent helicase Dna2